MGKMVRARRYSGIVANITARKGLNLQLEIDACYQRGARRFVLSGEFFPERAKNSLIELQYDSDIVIEASSKGAALNGSYQVMHVVLIREGRVTLRGLDICHGTTRKTGLWQKVKKGIPRASIYNFIDGPGIIVTGKASAIIEDCNVHDNDSFMCGAGISIQQHSAKGPVRLIHCRVFNNRAQDTGAGIDVLTPGSFLAAESCTFDNNKSNLLLPGVHRNGQVSLFPETFAELNDCTFICSKAPAVDFHQRSCIYMRDTHFVQPVKMENQVKKAGGIPLNILYIFCHLIIGAYAMIRYLDSAYPWITKERSSVLGQMRTRFLTKHRVTHSLVS